jgi:DeoR/GlpR family transcriptional regulator of sugar metabolism
LTTEDLAQMLGASLATVRRDTLTLEREGKIRRAYGGVMSVDVADEDVLDQEPLFAEKSRSNPEAKRRIAAVAAELVPEHATVIIDSGTTALALAQKLAGKNVMLIMMDLKAAQVASRGATEVWTIGGRVRNGLFSLVGAWAEGMLRGIHADLFFMSADAIDADAITNSTVDEAELKKLALSRAKKRVVIADHTKFNRRKLVPVCGLEAIDVLVTDEAARPHLAEYEARFGKILYA